MRFDKYISHEAKTSQETKKRSYVMIKRSFYSESITTANIVMYLMTRICS
jgi:hypothetical protein